MNDTERLKDLRAAVKLICYEIANDVLRGGSDKTGGDYADDILRLCEAAALAALPEKRDEYYGMGDCQDFSHCIPGYMDIESVEWWNESITTAQANIHSVFGGSNA